MAEMDDDTKKNLGYTLGDMIASCSYKGTDCEEKFVAIYHYVPYPYIITTIMYVSYLENCKFHWILSSWLDRLTSATQVIPRLY